MLGTTLAVAAVMTLAGWSLHALVERSLIAQVDRALIAKARMLASTIDQQGDELNLEFAEYDMSEFESAVHGTFLQLSTARGDVLYRSPSLGERTLELGAVLQDPSCEWIERSSGSRSRQVTLPFEPGIAEPGMATVPAKLALVLARDTRDVDLALTALRTLLLVVGLSTLAIAAVVLVWVVRSSVRPVAVVATRIAAIGERDLSTRLEISGVPSELVPVVQRVNELIARLDAAFARERAFSDDVAHELRTPLAGLRATLEVTGTRRRDEAEYAQAIQESTTIVSQLQSMVEQLLQLARLDAGRSTTESSGYDLADLVLEAWEPFAARALARGLRVDLHLEHGLEVSQSRELVGLILRNLHDNAVSYVEPGGHVRITTRRSGAREVRVEVSNSGSRLSQEQAFAASQRFWRGDAARSEVGLHCGLGLALVEKATQALGGELELRSEVGGEFVAEVRLPAAAPA